MIYCRYVYEESDRHQSIASSFLDTEWFEKIEVRDGLLFLAGGVFMYFKEEQIKAFFIKAADYFKTCDVFFDSLSPLGMKIAKKQVLKKEGMGMPLDEGWSLKIIKNIEKWDNRIKVVNAIPMSKGMKRGIPLLTKLVLTIPDMLGVCSMVQIRMAPKGRRRKKDGGIIDRKPGYHIRWYQWPSGEDCHSFPQMISYLLRP